MPLDAIWPFKTCAGHDCYVTSTRDIRILVQIPNRIKINLLQQFLYILGFGRTLFSPTKVAQRHKIFTLCKDNTYKLFQDNNLIMTSRMFQGSSLLDFIILFPPAAAFYVTFYGNISSF